MVVAHHLLFKGLTDGTLNHTQMGRRPEMSGDVIRQSLLYYYFVKIIMVISFLASSHATLCVYMYVCLFVCISMYVSEHLYVLFKKLAKRLKHGYLRELHRSSVNSSNANFRDRQQGSFLSYVPFLL